MLRPIVAEHCLAPFENESRCMLPVIPHEIAASSLEIACYGFTVLAALFTWLLTLRF